MLYQNVWMARNRNIVVDHPKKVNLLCHHRNSLCILKREEQSNREICLLFVFGVTKCFISSKYPQGFVRRCYNQTFTCTFEFDASRISNSTQNKPYVRFCLCQVFEILALWSIKHFNIMPSKEKTKQRRKKHIVHNYFISWTLSVDIYVLFCLSVFSRCGLSHLTEIQKKNFRSQ